MFYGAEKEEKPAEKRHLRFYGKDYYFSKHIHTHTAYAHSVTCSFMLAHDADCKWFGVISDLSISGSKNNTPMLAETGVLHVRFLRISSALEDWYPSFGG